MKKTYAFLAITLTLMLGTSACQKTPNESAVINKSDGKLEEAIFSTENSKEQLTAEDNWTEELTSEDGKATINVNAVIEIPDVTEVAVMSCKPYFFSTAEIENVIKVLYGDKAIYDDSVSGKKWLESEIINERANLEYLKRNGQYPEIPEEEGWQHSPVLDLEEEISWMEDRIAELESDYQIAAIEPQEIEEIKLEKNDDGYESISVKDDRTPSLRFYALNNRELNESVIRLDIDTTNYSSIEPLQSAEQLEDNISREEAESMALEVASACGISACKIVSAGRQQIEGQESYVFVLGRLVNGIPSISIQDYIGTMAFGTDGVEYREPWEQENIEVTINKNGVVGFLWEHPVELLETLNENVELKPYSEIKNIARNHFQRTQIADAFKLSEYEKNSIQVSKVVLNMMHIAEKDSLDRYYYLPVWDFLEYADNATADESEAPIKIAEKSVLTINAIDGSVIDRGLGY